MPIHLPSNHELAEFILPRLETWNVPGVAVAITDAHTTLVADGFGLRDIERGLPVGAESLFAIASNTKAFVCTALGLLVQEGKLAWDDRVRQFMPEFELYDPYVSDELRIRDLLCHRSGLATYAGDLIQGSSLPPDEILRRMKHLPQAFPFRAGYGYCNLLYLAAAKVLTTISGESWEAFIRRRLLEPLGMSRTVLSARDLPQGGNVATPYEEVDGKLVPVAYHKEDNVGPPGGICSTSSDLALWLRFQLAGGFVDGQRLVDTAILDETRTPHTPIPISPGNRYRYPGIHLLTYGLGWVIMDYRGRLLVRHTGGLDGMLSVTGFLPEESLGVAVLSNQNPNSFYMALFYHLIDTLLDLPVVDHSANMQRGDQEQARATRREWEERERSRPALTAALPPAALAGRYAHPYLGEASIEPDGDAWMLRLLIHPDRPGRLEAWDGQSLLCRWSEPGWKESLIPVERDDRGEVAAFRVRVREEWIDSLEYAFRRASPRSDDPRSA